MSVEYEDIVMELVKTLGESNKVLLERITNIEKNVATRKDVEELLSISREIRDNSKIAVNAVSKCVPDGSIEILTKWDKLWSSLLTGKGISTIVIGVICSIGGAIWFLFRLIQWFPVIKQIF